MLAPLPNEREPIGCPDWQIENGLRKLRQRQCKVCSILKRKAGERRTWWNQVLLLRLQQEHSSVRNAINTLQETFLWGYITPPVIAFEEGIMPSRNRKNPTRQYLKAKPHK